MPKEYRTGIRRTAMPEITQASVQPQVVASPVAVPDTGGFNVEDTMAGALLKGLSSLNPRLAAWSEQVTQQKRAEQTLAMQEEEKRETARGMAEAYRVGRNAPMPAHKTVAWAQGFMSTQGRMAGIEDGQQWAQFYEENKNKPDFDYQKARDEFVKKKQDGLSSVDRHYSEAYISQFASSDATVTRKRTADIVEAQERARDRSLDLSTRDLILNPAGPDGFAASFQVAQAEFINAGGDRDRFTDKLVDQLVATATESGRLDLLELAAVPLTPNNGWFLAANPKYNAKISAAAQAIVAKVKADANTGFNRAFNEAYVNLQGRIDGGEFKSVEEAAGEIQKLYDRFPDMVNNAMGRGLLARSLKGIAEGQHSARIAGLLADPERLRTASTKDRADALKMIEEGVGRLRFSPETMEQDVTKLSEALTQIHQLTGLAPVQLKQMFAFASMEGSGDGPPAAALGAIRVLDRLGEQGTKIDASKLMTNSDLAVVTTYQRLKDEGKTDAEAWAGAKKIQSPDAQNRAKKLWDENGAKYSKQLEKAVRSELRSWASLIPFVDAANMDDALVFAKDRARDNVAAGMSVEDAMKEAVTHLKANTMEIGGRMVIVPPTVQLSQDDIKVGIEAAQKEMGTNDIPMISKDGQMVFLQKADGTGVQPVSMARIAQLANIENAGPIATQGTAKAVEDLRTEVSGKPNAPLTREGLSKLPTDRIYKIDSWADDAVARGQITRWERAVIGDAVREHTERALHERLGSGKSFREMHGLKPGPLTESDAAAVTGVKPGDSGLPGVPNHNKIALRHYQSNPTAALLVAAEGFKLGAYDDPAKGGGRNIAAGYSLTNKAETKVRGDLKALGLTVPEINAVISGKQTLSVDQAMALTQRHLRNDVAPRARATFEATAGKGTWASLTPGERAALTYLEWSVKGGLSTYPKLMEALKKGDQETALKEYTIGFVNNGGTRQSASRAVALAKAMMRGPDSFLELIKKGI